jgi:hypothetical protein
MTIYAGARRQSTVQIEAPLGVFAQQRSSKQGHGRTVHRLILLLTAQPFGANRQATWRGTA